MPKKQIALLVLLSFLVGLLPPMTVWANETTVIGYIPISCGDMARPYKAILQNNELFLSVEDLAQLSGYVLETTNGYQFMKAGDQDSITSVDITSKGEAIAMGHTYQLTVLEQDGTTFLPLEKMLYLLHAKYYNFEKYLRIEPLGKTILDFIGSESYSTLQQNQVNQTDLLLGESEGKENFFTAIAAVFNDFDPMMFVLWWPGEGFVPALNKQYEEAMLQLAVDDQKFLDEYGKGVVKAALEKSSFAQAKSAWDSAKTVISFPETLNDYSENLDGMIKAIAEDSPDMKKFVEMHSNYDSSFLDVPQLKAWSREMEGMSLGLTAVDSIMAVMEVASRSKQWGDDYLAQIGVLTDFDDTGYNKFVAGKIREVANKLIQEHQDTVNASANEAAKRGVSFLLSNLFDVSPFGKCMAVFSTGIAIVKMDNDGRNYLDLKDLSYMVDCLVKIENLSMHETARCAAKWWGSKVDQQLTQDDLSHLRNSLMLFARTNIRNKTFVYYLNERSHSDKNWVKSRQAQAIQKEFLESYTALCEIMATEQYDEILLLDDSFDQMYDEKYSRVREPVNLALFCEGEIPIEQVILPQIQAASLFSWEWFWDSVYVDNNDTIMVNYYGIGWPYVRVSYEGVNSIQDVKALAKQYYTEAVAEKLISQKSWKEQNGKLYVEVPDGLGGIGADRYEVQITKDSDTQYTLTIYEILDGYGVEAVYRNVHYQYVDGKWVFDQVLHQWDPVPISIVDKENSSLHQYQYEYSVILEDVYQQYPPPLDGRWRELDYGLYDMNGDGIKELIVQTGTCEGDAQWCVYSIVDGTCELIGSFDGWHSVLYVGEHGEIYNLQGGSGFESITQITMENGILVEKVVSERQLDADSTWSSPGDILQTTAIIDKHLLAE